ncbi:MAG TPA: molybdate ABC transporter permease subunit [Clostridium sp.]|nr:molybdate ABC transporter permease subunit [Clostridium sp.]
MMESILTPVIISLKVAFVATGIVIIFGIALAWIFCRYSFKGKSVLETIILLPMCLPPTVVGYGMLIVMGRNGPLGKLTEAVFGGTLVFTWQGAAIGAAIVALPLMYESAKAGFLNVDITCIEAARIFGASDSYIFFHIVLPMVFDSIISGVILAFTRALGEFGASLMVAGNIPGKTQTIPIAIYFAMESGNRTQGNVLVAIVVVFSFIMVFWLNRWKKLRK